MITIKENIIKFTQDNNFIMYRDKTYYANHLTLGKEKPTKYYKLEELVVKMNNMVY